MRSIVSVLLIAAAASAGCATYTQDLNRAERHYNASDYERALTTFRLLEPDLDSLSAFDRARYAYLRGMTEYRMNQRSDARHWLAFARALDGRTPGALSPQWKERMTSALSELDRGALGHGDMIGESAEPGVAPTGL